VDEKASDKAEEKTESEAKDEAKDKAKDEAKGESEGDGKVEGDSKVESDSKVEQSPSSSGNNESEKEKNDKKDSSDADPTEASVSERKLAAPEKMASVVPTKVGRRQASDLSIFDLAVGVLLLVLLSQLLANSYIAYLGKSYNERVCKESIALAGDAANQGQDTPHVQLAAFGSMLHCPMDGLFIEHPELISFKDEIDPVQKTRIITICSSTKVRVPASFLILDKSCLVNQSEIFPEIAFKSTYQYKLTNPKGIEGKFILDKSGHLISRPPKSGKSAKGAAGAKPGAQLPTPAPGTDAKAAPAPGTGDGQVTDPKAAPDNSSKSAPEAKPNP
jgi:hypothetical protein